MLRLVQIDRHFARYCWLVWLEGYLLRFYFGILDSSALFDASVAFLGPQSKKFSFRHSRKRWVMFFKHQIKYWIRWCWTKRRATDESVVYRSLCWPNSRRMQIPTSCRKCAPPALPIVSSPLSWRSPKCCCWATWPSENPASSIGQLFFFLFLFFLAVEGGVIDWYLLCCIVMIDRFCHSIFDHNYKATIGVDFEVERFDILRVPFNLQMSVLITFRCLIDLISCILRSVGTRPVRNDSNASRPHTTAELTVKFTTFSRIRKRIIGLGFFVLNKLSSWCLTWPTFTRCPRAPNGWKMPWKPTWRDHWFSWWELNAICW